MSVPFEIDVQHDHGTEVRLNGEKVPGLYDVVLRHKVGEPSTLALHIRPVEGEIVGEAEVRFEVGGRVFVGAAKGEPLQPDSVRSEVR